MLGARIREASQGTWTAGADASRPRTHMPCTPPDAVHGYRNGALERNLAARGEKSNVLELVRKKDGGFQTRADYESEHGALGSLSETMSTGAERMSPAERKSHLKRGGKSGAATREGPRRRGVRRGARGAPRWPRCSRLKSCGCKRRAAGPRPCSA